ncbi:hypothetical protein V2J09_001496 [Rumex salicifolius]
MADGDVLHNLQLQLASLQSRVKDLESENSILASRLLKCRCHQLIMGMVTWLNLIQVEENSHKNAVNGVVPMAPSGKLLHGACRSIKKSFKSLTIPNHSKRHVVLKIMFYGFSSEAQMEPSIESELFKAFEKTRLLVGDRKESQYSRCGRTDKGVSAVGQGAFLWKKMCKKIRLTIDLEMVVALYLRSKIKVGCEDATKSPEIDYVRVINGALPNDIRVIGWCPAPVDLHARFSCLSREYKYFFWRENLDISAMENAGRKFVGEYDFRNFCKMDAVNVHIYDRRVTCFEISLAERFGCNELWVFNIRGSAFLWHQVRCMVAVLFMIGQGLETADVIDAMLDTERVPRKPQYLMASEAPLVLHSCEFKDLHFCISPDARKALRVHLQNEWQTHLMEAAIFNEVLLSLSPTENGEIPANEPPARRKLVHIPLLTRETEPSYEERRAKINSGRVRKELINSKSEVETG